MDEAARTATNDLGALPSHLDDAAQLVGPQMGELQKVADGVWLLPGFGNTTIVEGRRGLAVVDPGLFINGPRVVEALRALTEAPVTHVVYTHGHYDHAFGTHAIVRDAARRGFDEPAILGHTNVARRFDRYQKTSGHIGLTMEMQFSSWGVQADDIKRVPYHYPTLTFEDEMTIDLGGVTMRCRHGLGETDDHTWVWVPERRVIVGGDFIVSSFPNAGTPFRVQRYVLEWAEALEEMASTDPLAIVSGHGGVFTRDAREMLDVTARACRWIDGEVVRRLNDGQWDEEILSEVKLPDELEHSPHLQPLYGCTAFAVRDVLRRYKGWFDGNASMLFPSSRAEIASEVVSLTGGVEPLVERAETLASAEDAGSLQKALHLLDFVIFDGGQPADDARRRKAELLERRAKFEKSFVAKNVLRSSAAAERKLLG